MNPPNASAAPAYTPEPWKIEPSYDGSIFYVGRSIHDRIADVRSIGYDDESEPSVEIGRANAHLIAAAPDLLAALRGLATHFLNIDHDCNRTAERLAMRDAVWAVIAKAEGRT